MIQKLIRLVCVAALGVLAYFVAVWLACEPIFFIVPCLFWLLHMILWDLLKFKIFDYGFFRFIKFIIFVGAFVVLMLFVIKQSLPMITTEYFSMESEAKDIQRQVIGGAIAMLSFTFVLCLGCVQSFPSRWVGLGVPVLGIALGILFGFLPAFFAFFGLGIGKVFACAILLLPVGVIFAYIKENGLLYKDLGYDDAFGGLGLEKLRRSSSGGGALTSYVSADAEGPAPDWRDWQYIAKRQSYQRSLSYGALYVDVQYSHGSNYVDFYIDGQYEISGATDQYQVDSAADEVRSIMADVQQSVFDEAVSAANGHVKVSVRVRNLRRR